MHGKPSFISAACLSSAVGSVAMVSLQSRQLLFKLKMNGTARTAAFSADGLELLTMGVC